MDRPDGLKEEDLLDYARGDATPEQAAQIEAAAAEAPELQAELALMAGLKDALAASTAGSDARAFGWKRLEAEIGRTSRPTAPPRREIWRVAAIFLGAAVLAQGAYIALVPSGAEAPVYRTVSGQTEDIVLAVAFVPTATAEEIEVLLREVQARIVDGPSAVGFYRLAFEDEATRRNQRQVLDASPLIDLVAEE